MSLHIEPTEDAVETLRKERRKNYIAALATSILSVVLAGAILYSLTIIIAPPEEPKVVGYITPDDAPPSDTPPPPEVQRETSSSSHAETPVKPRPEPPHGQGIGKAHVALQQHAGQRHEWRAGREKRLHAGMLGAAAGCGKACSSRN